MVRPHNRIALRQQKGCQHDQARRSNVRRRSNSDNTAHVSRSFPLTSQVWACTLAKSALLLVSAGIGQCRRNPVQCPSLLVSHTFLTTSPTAISLDSQRPQCRIYLLAIQGIVQVLARCQASEYIARPSNLLWTAPRCISRGCHLYRRGCKTNI